MERYEIRKIIKENPLQADEIIYEKYITERMEISNNQRFNRLNNDITWAYIFALVDFLMIAALYFKLFSW